MRQRIIVVPKDKIAEEALDFNGAKEEQLIEFPIGEEDFLFMYHNGIIDLININGDALVDDYEDDWVIGKDNLSKVIKALNLRIALGGNIKHQLMNNVLSLFEEAFNRDTGVYFFF